MPTYSFVVPVYNCKEYLCECIESILNQTNRDFEIVLVDDGSTDGSSELCDTIKNSDQRIIVIHKTNGGPASSRNVGIENSTGQYVWFIDSDDRISEANALEKVNDICMNYNVDELFFLSADYDAKFEKIISSPKNYSHNGFYDCSGEEMLVDSYISKDLMRISTSPVNKVIKRDVIQNHNLRFVEEFRCYEEDELLPKVLLKSVGFYFLNEKLYEVRVRDNSVSTNRQADVLLEKIGYRLKLADMSQSYFWEECKTTNAKKTMMNYYAFYFLNAINDYTLLNAVDQNECIKMIAEHKNLFEKMWYSKSKYLKIVWVIYKILGVRLTVFAVIRNRK